MKKAPYKFKFEWKEVVMCLTGLGLLSWAIWTWGSYDYDKQTRAKVFDREKQTICYSKRCSNSSTIEIVYTDENGIEHNVKNVYDKYRNDKEIDIFYNSKNPSKVTTFSRGETLGGYIVMFGVIYIASYVAFYLYREKQKPQMIEFMTGDLTRK
jgi:hypothetical protein